MLPEESRGELAGLTAAVSSVVLTVSASVGMMDSVYCWLPVSPMPSVAVTVNTE